MSEFSSQPKILQLMLSTQPGGAEMFFEKLTLAFAESGVQQCLIIEPNAEREALFADIEGLEIVPLRFGGLREWSARARLRRVFAAFKPDCALTWMNRASRRAPKGYCPVIGRLGGYYKLKNYQNCTDLIGITPDLVDHILAGDWPADRAHLIPNFGEVAQPESKPEAARQALRAELGIQDDTPVLLALGRLHEVKAHDTLIRALAQSRHAPVLLIAGEGPLREELTHLAEQLGVAERVRFLGWRRDIGRLFSACDLCVFPSRYEPNGTVVMESWAQGKPLLSSRAKGPEWLVDDGVNGLLFKIDAVDELAAKMDTLLADPELCARLVAGGREKWKTCFSKQVVVEQYLDLFERAAARQSK